MISRSTTLLCLALAACGLSTATTTTEPPDDTVARPLESPALVIDVKALIAAAGNPSDHTAILQAAFAQARTAGGAVIWFQPGAYNTRQTLEVPSNTVLRGSGSQLAGGCQLRLAGPTALPFDLALLSIRAGVSNVTIRDLELRSLTSGWNVWPRGSDGERARIDSENSAAVRFHGSASDGVSTGIVLENVSIADFTVGVQVTSDTPDSLQRTPAPARATDVTEVDIPGIGRPNDPQLHGLAIRSVTFSGNHVAIHLRSSWARDLDLENADVANVPRFGAALLVERGGAVLARALNCAAEKEADGSDATDSVCVEVWEHGLIGLWANHVEGVRFSLLTKSRPGMARQFSPIILQEAILPAMRIEAASELVSIASLYFQTSPSGYRAHWAPRFVGPRELRGASGNASHLSSCNDLFVRVDHLHEFTVVNQPNGFPGLDQLVVPCDFDPSLYRLAFSTQVTPPVSTPHPRLDVRDYGAIAGDDRDDDEAFQAAFDDALGRNAGGIVYAPPGVYRIGHTLELHRASMLEGPGAILELTAPSTTLMRQELIGGDLSLNRGVTVRDVTFRIAKGLDRTGTTGLEFIGRPRPCNGQPLCLGSASDYAFHDLTFIGFERGFRVHPEADRLTLGDMMIDSVRATGLRFVDDELALELQSANVSNWSFTGVRIEGVTDGRRGLRVSGAGNITFKDVTCSGTSALNAARPGTCAVIDIGGVSFDGLVSRGVGRALHARPAAGYSIGGMAIRNSMLTDGVYLEGRVRLMSINNKYPSSDPPTKRAQPGVRSLAIGTYREGDPNAEVDPGNPSPGTTSFVHTCKDVVGEVSPDVGTAPTFALEPFRITRCAQGL